MLQLVYQKVSACIPCARPYPPVRSADRAYFARRQYYRCKRICSLRTRVSKGEPVMTTSFYTAQTDDDFAKAHNKALFNEIQHFMNPEEASLISFTDIKSL